MSSEPMSSPASQNVPARRMVEGESEHGHGMSRNRTPKNDAGLPHDDKRDQKQPYSREVEDYSGDTTRAPREEGQEESGERSGKDA